MNTSSILKRSRIICGALTFVLTAAIATPLPAYAAPLAPSSCYSDSGTLVQPQAEGRGAFGWTFVANFNHIPNRSHTKGCYAIMDERGTVSFTEVNCAIVNGSRRFSVGNGSVTFDGLAYIECAMTPVLGAFGAQGKNYTFDVASTVTLNDLRMNATLVQDAYRGVYFSVGLNEFGTMKMTSQYGNASFADDTGISTLGKTVRVKSILSAPTGAHELDSVAQHAHDVPGFTLQHNNVLRFGNPGERFVMHEIIIDPRGSCCG